MWASGGIHCTLEASVRIDRPISWKRAMYADRWQVLHVITNHEKRVAQHLTARSLEHFLPLYTERSQWTDRVVRLERPLFAGYVFVRVGPEARLSVITTPGVLRLLGETERDTVSAVEINRIRDGLASGCLLRPHSNIVLGCHVRVLKGVFQGAEGVVTDLRQNCKVVMILDATRQSFSLQVDPGEIEILCKPPVPQLIEQDQQLALRGT